MDLREFFIRPFIPESIKDLHELAFNIWTCWDKDAEKLFHRIDPIMFRKFSHNPLELLYRMSPERLNEISKDKGFLHELNKVYTKYKNYMSLEGTYVADGIEKPYSKEDTVVYICMEYGLHESIPLYSGGLAVLAGDQLKAVSDMGIPMVSFGLMYRHGYFNQHITPDGTQIEEFRESAWYLRAVREVLGDDGTPVIIQIPLIDEMVSAKIWQIHVGKVPLYLLDTNIHQNPPKFRKITNMLYDSDRKTRLIQELVLGRGTVLALKALGIKPKVYHLNEGHTAFAILERLIELVKGMGLSLDDARNIIRYSTVFTTHTPVVEGNEHFAEDLIKEYLEAEVETLGMTMNEFLALGKIKKEKMFWLPAFALRYSRRANGVSKIHANVSREMWRDIYPAINWLEFPIEAVTNGVHVESWLSLQMTELFERYLGPDFLQNLEYEEMMEKLSEIPDGEIWNAHRRRKEQVISFIRRRVGDMMRGRGYGRNKIKDVEQVLHPDWLTIGFARRFASYKRAALLLSDPERLVQILTNPERPVQLVFAGKAHPADGMGKELIKKIMSFINDYPVENHVVFIEDYDINVARHLVQGVDVWLNTPVKPMEASGTSGMKAGVNGVLNLSVLDGWWPEAYNGENGWAIAGFADGGDPELTQVIEANHFYELLENDVAEMFYDRTETDVPTDWVRMMKNSIASVGSGFSMRRAVAEYLHMFYLPQIDMSRRLSENNYALLAKVGEYKKKIDAIWPSIYIRDYFTSIHGKMPVSGEQVNVDCYVYLGDCDEKLFGAGVFYCFDKGNRLYKKIPLTFVEKYHDKVGKFTGSLSLEGIGLQELTVYVSPSDPDFNEIYPEYVKWKD